MVILCRKCRILFLFRAFEKSLPLKKKQNLIIFPGSV